MRAAGLTVPVFVTGWQIECCGIPPAEGDGVSWRLDWNPGYATILPTDFALTARLERMPPLDPDTWYADGRQLPGSESVPAIARAGPLSVFVCAPLPIPAEIRLTGVLHEDHHIDSPPETPLTTGRIARVRLVSWDYRQLDDGGWEAVDGSAQLTDVWAAPKHMPRTSPRRGALRWRQISDVLVDLEVSVP